MDVHLVAQPAVSKYCRIYDGINEVVNIKLNLSFMSMKTWLHKMWLSTMDLHCSATRIHVVKCYAF